MCGRFVSSTPPDQLAEYFDVDVVPEQLSDRGPNFNTAPTTGIVVVYAEGGTRCMDSFRWGLVPSWAKDVSVGNRMINARAETVASKPAFRRAFAKRRCIIPADGFYEWKAAPGGGKGAKKQPYFIHRPDGEPFAFAGLWEVWKGDTAVPPAAPLRSCTIVTTEANDKMSELHDRMPAILPRAAWDDWLSPEVDDTELLGRFLVPAPSEIIEFHPVSTEVNNVRNKGEQLAEPVELEEEQPLFVEE